MVADKDCLVHGSFRSEEDIGGNFFVEMATGITAPVPDPADFILWMHLISSQG
jgi:hypothetical protein